MNKFGQFVREKRMSLNLTIKDLAKKIGISVVQLSNVEFGYNLPRINSIHKYASALGCNADELTNVWLEDHYARTK